MDKALQEKYGRGAAITYVIGPSSVQLEQMCGSDRMNAVAVYANKRHEPAMAASDARTTSTLKKANISVRLLQPLFSKLNEMLFRCFIQIMEIIYFQGDLTDASKRHEPATVASDTVIKAHNLRIV